MVWERRKSSWFTSRPRHAQAEGKRPGFCRASFSFASEKARHSLAAEYGLEFRTRTCYTDAEVERAFEALVTLRLTRVLPASAVERTNERNAEEGAVRGRPDEDEEAAEGEDRAAERLDEFLRKRFPEELPPEERPRGDEGAEPEPEEAGDDLGPEGDQRS